MDDFHNKMSARIATSQHDILSINISNYANNLV